MTFTNREDAGQRLVEQLIAYRDQPATIILALPRGGVVVGYQLSVGLHLPLDVFISRKLGAPGNPEYALGAVSETGTIYFNPDARMDVRTRANVDHLVQLEQQEIVRRQALYRQGRPLPALTDHIVILVDDGIATGSTFFVSAEAIRQLRPKRLIGALPVGPSQTIRLARTLMDEVVVLATPEPFWAVGNHYGEFTQVNDADVVTYLVKAEEALREKCPPGGCVGLS